MKSTVFIVMFLVVFAGFAEKQPIGRYQSIIERQMFGPLPPGFDPTKSPNEVQKSSSKDEKQLTQEQEKLQSSIHFSVINVASDGQTEVGFTDNSDPKAPKHYFMKVGESRDGWTVKEANAENATMTIAKGEIEVSLSLGGNSAKDGGTSKAGGAVASAARNGGKWRSGLFGGDTLRARRLKRKQAAAADEAKQREEQAAREAERQAQAEQERQQREDERNQQFRATIQEEIRKLREQRTAENAAAAKVEGGGDGAANNEAE